MREDMFKVIVERPRRIRGKKCKVRRKGRWREELGRLDDMAWRGERIRQHGESIWLNENLAPLRRFLHRSVGRKWNDVYSEICENLSVRSAVQQHVRDHVQDFVAIHAEVIDGRVRTLFRNCHRSPLYVDPADGVLRAARREGFKRARIDPVGRVRLDECRELRAIRGVWYEVLFARVPDDGRPRFVWDVLERREMNEQGLRNVYGSVRYACGKRQLNSRELRRYRAEHPAAFN